MTVRWRKWRLAEATPGGGDHTAWSPTGEWIAHVRGGALQLTSAADGQTQKALAARRRPHLVSHWTDRSCTRFGTLPMEGGFSRHSMFRAARNEGSRRSAFPQERPLQDSASIQAGKASPRRSGSPGTTSGSSKDSGNRRVGLTGSDGQAARWSSSIRWSQPAIWFQLANVWSTTISS